MYLIACGFLSQVINLCSAGRPRNATRRCQCHRRSRNQLLPRSPKSQPSMPYQSHRCHLGLTSKFPHPKHRASKLRRLISRTRTDRHLMLLRTITPLRLRLSSLLQCHSQLMLRRRQRIRLLRRRLYLLTRQECPFVRVAMRTFGKMVFQTSIKSSKHLRSYQGCF